MIVVLDSNIWISALEFGGAPGLALTQASTIDQLAISDFSENEVIRVLTRKFHRDSAELRAVLDEILLGRIPFKFGMPSLGFVVTPMTIPSWKPR